METFSTRVTNYHMHNCIDFDKIIEINSGGSGVIYKYECKCCKITKVLKCLRDGTQIQNFNSEVEILRIVQGHPNIITFYGVTEDPSNGHYFMILQYVDKDLRDYLKENFKNLQFVDKFRMAEEIAQGLWFLHTKNIVHGDLNSKNILVYNSQIKIIDFGMSKQINKVSTPLCSEIKGMPAYIDPQCFKDLKYDKKSDIFSLGVILWEVSGGQPPFKLLTSPAIFWNMQVLNEFREIPAENTPLQYIKLYKNCWDKDPSIRPEMSLIIKTLNELKNSSIFNV
ncbi:kinase-like protein [Gigaspora margarita]|uniref:Kinase-like protein n=1 Tax=Gigaspora margarita TaxID=4874 RepID=A0A8H4EI37_GIGMA|nr:kinase-like protein [Gigaspora margarita]